MLNTQKRFYGAVFLISGVITALQIMQLRIFSVTTWYHLSFLVISIAMFGLTLGALKIYAQNENDVRRDYLSIARNGSYFCGISILVTLLVQLFFPLVSDNFWQTLIMLPFVAAVTGSAYYFAGLILTVSLTRSPYPVGKTYGFDLFGAAAGCLTALCLMKFIDTPSGVVLLAALAGLAGLLYEAPASAIKKKISFLITFSVLLAGLNGLAAKPIFYPIWAKNKFILNKNFSYEKWNAISRVTVFNEQTGKPFLWGPSTKLPENLSAAYSFLTIDSDAGTPITRLDGDIRKHSYLEYDVTNLAYTMPDINNAAIIGVGGGRDALSAKYFGVKEVTAMDVNPVQINLLRDHKDFSAYAGLVSMDGMKLIQNEARSWFRQNEEKFDLIEMSLIDTWAATGAGAFALSENGLYTREAWSIFFHDLSDHGVFTVSRWAVEGYMDDTARLLSLAIATLFEEGVKNPAEHIVMASNDNIVTLILSKSPFSPPQLDALYATARSKDYKILASPLRPAQDGVLKELLNAHEENDLEDVAAKQVYDISPTTDMKPFFFNQARFSKPWMIAKLAFEGGPSTLYGQAKATFNLFLIIVFSFVMVTAVIVMPLGKRMAGMAYPAPFVIAGSVYFVLIGLGFMVLEVSLLQAFGVYLGHPVYGLGIVLFSLILSTGAGSFISEKFPLTTTVRQIAWCVAIFICALALCLYLDDIFSMFAETSLFHRALVSVSVLFPLGVLLGFGFPTGIRVTTKLYSQSGSWFWGINGAAGVLGSALAIALNIGLGIDVTILLAGFAYLTLAVPLVYLSRQ